jgi:hypothetical protein
MNRRDRFSAPIFAALLLVGLAGEALAAPAPTVTASISADASCLLTLAVSAKNVKIAHIYVGWYEAGYVNSTPGLGEFVATSEWPFTNPAWGSAKGKSLFFYFGPTGTDTATRDWWALVQPYDANGVALPQVTTNRINVNCYVPSPA